MVDIIVWILFGALAGWIASLLTQTSNTLTGDVAIGVLGALLGGLIVRAIGGAGMAGFNFASFFVAVMGSVVLICGFRTVNRG